MSQRLEARGVRFEAMRREFRGCMIEARGYKFDVIRLYVKGERPEVRCKSLGDRGKRLEVRGPRSEARGSRFELGGLEARGWRLRAM